MATATRRNVLGEGPDPRSRLYWLDIDVNFQEIVRQSRFAPTRAHVRRPPSSLQYCILNGVGTVANALSVGEQGTTFQSFEVDVAALVQPDEGSDVTDPSRSARMIWNEVDVRSPRLEIYVQTKMLRHLVELFITKRIDTVIMSMKIAVMLEAIGAAESGRGIIADSLTRTGASISGARIASSCRCMPRWQASASGESPANSRPSRVPRA